MTLAHVGCQREALRRSAPETEARRSGLYLRYELFVAFLLEQLGSPPRALFGRRLDPQRVERDLEAARDL